MGCRDVCHLRPAFLFLRILSFICLGQLDIFSAFFLISGVDSCAACWIFMIGTSVVSSMSSSVFSEIFSDVFPFISCLNFSQSVFALYNEGFLSFSNMLEFTVRITGE